MTAQLSKDQHDSNIYKQALGRELRTRWQNASGATLRSSETFLTTRTGTSILPGTPAAVWQTLVDNVVGFDDGDISYANQTSRLIRKVEYSYDGYGNVTAERDYGYQNNTSDNRTTMRVYRTNESAWIIGKVQRENMQDGIVTADTGGNSATSTALKARTFVCYDSDPATYCDSTILTRGQLTGVKRNPLYAGEALVMQQASYDAMGDLNSLTDARGYATTAGYDATRQFVISTSAPATPNAPSGLTTQYGYYGVNENLCGVGGYGRFGQLMCVIDPNNQVTHYG